MHTRDTGSDVLPPTHAGMLNACFRYIIQNDVACRKTTRSTSPIRSYSYQRCTRFLTVYARARNGHPRHMWEAPPPHEKYVRSGSGIAFLVHSRVASHRHLERPSPPDCAHNLGVGCVSWAEGRNGVPNSPLCHSPKPSGPSPRAHARARSACHVPPSARPPPSRRLSSPTDLTLHR